MTETTFGSHAAPAPRYTGTSTSSVYIPMRDGVELAVEVFLPGDLEAGARIPALLSQTRYWRAKEMRAPFKWFLTPDVLEPDERDLKLFFTSHGYALVLLDVRGTGASFGAWPHPWPEDSVADSAEVVDWIVSQPWSDGNVGGYGISYVGTTAELLAVPDHPAVKAVIPMFNHPDAFTDIAFPGGIFHERFMSFWSDFDRNLDSNVVPGEFGFLGRLLLRGVKPVDGDRGRRLLRKAVEGHGSNGHAFSLGRPLDYRDSRTEGTDLTVEDVTVHRFKKEIEGSRAVSFGWGSWMDAGTADAVIRRFLTFDNSGGGAIGAWEHCGRFNASPYRSPDAPPSPTLREQWSEMLRFFDAHLRGGRAAGGERQDALLLHAGRREMEGDLRLATRGHGATTLVPRRGWRALAERARCGGRIRSIHRRLRGEHRGVQPLVGDGGRGGQDGRLRRPLRCRQPSARLHDAASGAGPGDHGVSDRHPLRDLDARRRRALRLRRGRRRERPRLLRDRGPAARSPPQGLLRTLSLPAAGAVSLLQGGGRHAAGAGRDSRRSPSAFTRPPF